MGWLNIVRFLPIFIIGVGIICVILFLPSCGSNGNVIKQPTYLQTAYGVLSCSSYEHRSCGVYGFNCTIVSAGGAERENYMCLSNVRIINVTG